MPVPVTTKDVARKAGVSQATVSRVLKNHHYVNEETRQKVLKAIEELGYQPNIIARSMALQKTHALGLMVSDLTNPFYSELAKSIINRAKELGYNVIIYNKDTEDVQATYLDFLQQRRVDGIIFTSVELKDSKVEKLVKAGFPCVFCNRRLKLKTSSFICSDNKKGAKIAVKHLINLGHKHIGYISGPNNYSTALERLEGYIETVREHGLHVDNQLIKQGYFNNDYAYSATRELISIPNPPTAIFVSNDLMALAAMEAVLDAGLRVPEDIALVGYDDIKISGHKLIQLTTVAQHMETMGRLAVDELVQMLSRDGGRQKPVHKFLEPELIIRETCGYRLAKK